MPIDADTPLFPSHETLARFFARDPRKRVPLAEVAELLGVSVEMFRAMLKSEGGRRSHRTLTWEEAAGYLFDAWPRAQLLKTLGPEHAGGIPRQFRPTRVTWSIPIFIVRAMEHQADARGVHDYIADLLFNEIQDQTIDAFRNDEAFLEAYRYPE